MNKIRKAWYSVLMTLGAFGLWFAAMGTVQPTVPDAPLPLVQISSKTWIHTNDYTAVFNVFTNTYRITIREGFKTDLASLGKLDDALGVHRDDPCIKEAADIHDALYATRYIPRDQADIALYVRCLRNGMERHKALAVYQAVKTWGWLAWDKHDIRSIEESRKLITVEVP